MGYQGRKTFGTHSAGSHLVFGVGLDVMAKMNTSVPAGVEA
jgi:hypothetical protein